MPHSQGGRGKQYIARPRWIDYYSNLAVLTVEDAAFWTGLQPVQLLETLPLSGNLQVYRWRSGRIEARAAEIIRLYVGSSKMSYIQHLKLAASSEIDSAGWAEVVIHAGRLIRTHHLGGGETHHPCPPLLFNPCSIAVRWRRTPAPAVLISAG